MQQGRAYQGFGGQLKVENILVCTVKCTGSIVAGSSLNQKLQFLAASVLHHAKNQIKNADRIMAKKPKAVYSTFASLKFISNLNFKLHLILVDI